MSSPALKPYPLTGEIRTVTLDGSGNGTVRWTPGQAGAPGSGVGAARYSGYSVDVSGCSVQVATHAKEASCVVYLSRGVQALEQLQGNTFTGSSGDTCSINQNLIPQDWITAIWSGGDAGALATLAIIGTVNPPGA